MPSDRYLWINILEANILAIRVEINEGRSMWNHGNLPKNVPQITFAGPFRMALILSLYSLSLQLNSELPCRLSRERVSTRNILIGNGPPGPQKMSQSLELLCRILFDTSLSTPDIIRSSIPDAEQQAEALEIYNHAISPICTLPLELRIHVLRYLSVADVMALRLVSRSFFSSTQR
jgi:hypothetical protein